MSHKTVKYMFLFFALGLLISNSFAISESLGKTVKPVMPYAALSANKYIEKTNLTLGETTLVVVNITNFGNLTAFDIKIEEPLVPVGIIKLESKPHLDTLSQLLPNSSYVYYYKFKAESLGDYFIPPTVVSWNSNGTNFTVSSQGYTRCNICGRPHSVYKDFGLCRICLRKMANEGLIPGMRKASW